MIKTFYLTKNDISIVIIKLKTIIDLCYNSLLIKNCRKNKNGLKTASNFSIKQFNITLCYKNSTLLN